MLCHECANRENGSEASTAAATPPDWRLVACDIHYEGEPLQCEHCSRPIRPAYDLDHDDPPPGVGV